MKILAPPSFVLEKSVVHLPLPAKKSLDTFAANGQVCSGNLDRDFVFLLSAKYVDTVLWRPRIVRETAAVDRGKKV